MSFSLSTRSRYGVRLMAVLAADWGRGSTLLRDISRREGISEKYLGQIVIPLKTAGLVGAQRGSRGGYSLSRAPAEITVLQVVEAIEGPVAPAPCTGPEGSAGEPPCDRATTACAASAVWRKLRGDIEAALSSFTLADLAARARQFMPAVSSYSI
jgi:Rrf2 family cysteine metabolism transcriptional repressor